MAPAESLCILVFLIFPFLSSSLPVFLRQTWLHGEGMLGSFTPTSSKPIPQQWFEQKLDHFDKKNDKTWQQRYWMNASFWKNDTGPVFLFIGGEGESSYTWLLGGEMMDLAKKYKGLAIVFEHRFYGTSQPTGDLKISSLKHLSSRQALADMAGFHDYIVKQYKMVDKNRWIAFGGSYSGALAAWMRIKYPDTVYGAVATSAPVLAEYDFSEYLEVVQNSLLQARNGKKCVDAIHSGMNKLQGYLKDHRKWKSVDERFRLNPPLNSTEDTKLLSLNVAGIFMGIVQYNNDSRGTGNYDMNILCDVMTNSSIKDPLDRLTVLFNTTEPRIDTNFNDYLDALNKTHWSAFSGERQWFYQTCAEFGYFQTSDSKKQPFGSLISMDLYTKVCQEVFGITPDEVKANIQDTNKYYGGQDINKKVTNIVFPNGSIDPWHALGIIKDITSHLKAVYITGTAHCANMYPSNKYDRKELIEAREKISDIVGEWLSS